MKVVALKDEQIEKLLTVIRDGLIAHQQKGLDVNWLRRAIDVTQPGDEWMRYEPAKQSYILIRVGPPDVQLENVILAAFGIDSMNFKK